MVEPFQLEQPAKAKAASNATGALKMRGFLIVYPRRRRPKCGSFGPPSLLHARERHRYTMQRAAFAATAARPATSRRTGGRESAGIDACCRNHLSEAGIGGYRSAESCNAEHEIVGACLDRALGLLSAAGIDHAAAQVVSDPNQIRYCLCQQQYVLALQDNVNVRQRTALNSSQRQRLAQQSSRDPPRRHQRLQQRRGSTRSSSCCNSAMRRSAATAGDVTDAYDRAANAYNEAVAGL